MVKKSDDKKTLIIESYIQLIVSNGVQNCSMQEVAKNAGVATGSIYNYFSGKAELVNESYQYVRSSGLEFAGSDLSPDMDRHERFCSIFGNLCRFFLQNTTYFEFSERFTYGPEITNDSRDVIHERYADYLRLISDGIADGEFRSMDPKLMFRYLWGCASSLARYSLRENKEISDDEVKDYVDFMWDSIQS